MSDLIQEKETGDDQDEDHGNVGGEVPDRGRLYDVDYDPWICCIHLERRRAGHYIINGLVVYNLSLPLFSADNCYIDVRC